MTRWGLGSGMLLAFLAVGCAPPQRNCLTAAAACNALLGPCEPPFPACTQVPAGATQALVDITSSPTTAEIYLDGKPIGRTPVTHPLWYTSRTRFITLTAEPLYPGQARQEHRLQVPPLPAHIRFFMNNPPKSDAESLQEP
jgi:hypothetical protein